MLTYPAEVVVYMLYDLFGQVEHGAVGMEENISRSIIKIVGEILFLCTTLVFGFT